ncbi:hypothetical protein DSO57_1013001 [Entomophthora muscae]|uniref:Uncharacterized protein n=1 Tax=Entomophthora muscae TaxID=34485 RepID=A0ACC2UGA0_9FUNG|nr:hypothetical protein DSO57_1013001 [Entomophthora muscae]
MELPVTPKPMPASSPELPIDHTSKLFGIVGGGHHYTGRRPVIFLGEVCFLPSKVSFSLVVGPARKNPSPSYPRKQQTSAQDWVLETHEGVKMCQIHMMVEFSLQDSEGGTVPVDVRLCLLHPI